MDLTRDPPHDPRCLDLRRSSLNPGPEGTLPHFSPGPAGPRLVGPSYVHGLSLGCGQRASLGRCSPRQMNLILNHLFHFWSFVSPVRTARFWTEASNPAPFSRVGTWLAGEMSITIPSASDTISSASRTWREEIGSRSGRWLVEPQSADGDAQGIAAQQPA